VAVVREALAMGFGHLDYTGSEDAVIAKWHSWVLSSIGTNEAILLLREHAKSSHIRMAQAMTYRLSRMGL
jgi:hypothetical protein